MKGKLLLVLLYCFFQDQNLFSQSTFQILLGDSGRMMYNLEIYETKDSGFISSAFSKSADHQDLPRLIITKLDKAGSIVWSKYHLLPESFNSGLAKHMLKASNDGGSITILRSGSHAYDGAFHVSQIGILKTDSSGDIQWLKFINPFAASNQGIGIVADEVSVNADGSYTITGEVSVPDSAYDAFPFMMRIDNTGTLVSNTLYPDFNNHCCLYSSSPQAKTINGHIIFTTRDMNKTIFHKTDFLGHLMESTVIDYPMLFQKILPLEDTSFFAGGTYYSVIENKLKKDLGFSFFDKNLFNTGYYTLGIPDVHEILTDAIDTEDGILVAGLLEEPKGINNSFIYTPFILKINFGVEWSRKFSKFNCNHASVGGSKILLTSDGGILMYSHSVLDTVTGQRFETILKLDSLGISGCENESLDGYVFNNYFEPPAPLSVTTWMWPLFEGDTSFIPAGGTGIPYYYDLCPPPDNSGFQYSQFQNLLVYPNPVKDILNILLPPDDINLLSAGVYNLLGQEILYKKFEKLPHCEYCDMDRKREIGVMQLESGIYHIKIQTETQIYTARFFKR